MLMKKNVGMLSIFSIVLVSIMFLIPAFVISLPSVFAAQNVTVIELNHTTVREDFFASITVNAGKELKTCSCSDTTTLITLKNTGTVPSFYTLTTQGSAAQYITLVPNILRLEPNEQQQIAVHLNAPCQQFISQEFRVTIETNLGLKKVIQQPVTYVPCTNIELRTAANAYVNCPCTPTHYSVELVNTGDFPEMYKLNVDGLSHEYYSISTSQVWLPARQKEIVELYITTPCEVYGVQSFSVTATAQTSGFSTVLPLYLDASQTCYQFNVQLGNVQPIANETVRYAFTPAATPNYKVCEEGMYMIPVRVNNPSNILNNHELVLDKSAPSWASLNYDTIQLWPKQQADSAVVLAPQKYSEGNYSVNITTTTVRGDVSKVTPLNVEVLKCLPDEEEEAFADEAWFVVLILGIAILGILIALAFLTKPQVKEFKLEKSKKKLPLWVKIALIIAAVVIVIALLLLGLYIYYTVKVAPASGNVTQSTITNITNATKLVGTKLNTSVSTIVKNATVKLNTTLNLNATHANTSLTNVSFSWSKIWGNVTNVVKMSPAKKYTVLSLAGILGLAVLALLILAIIKLVKKYLKYLQKRKEEKLALQPLPPVPVVPKKKAQEKKEVKKASLEAAKEHKAEKKEKEKTEKKTGNKVWKIIGYVLLVLLVLGIFAGGFYGIKKLSTAPLGSWVNMTKNVTAKVSGAETPTKSLGAETQPKTENFTVRIWSKNTPKIINLSKNVKDPDNDKITFSFTPVQNISIAVKDGIATLTPTKDFSGVRYVVFRASDGKDEITLPRMTLIVTDTEDEKPFYIGWIVAGVIVLGILVTAAVIVAKNKKKE